MHRLLKRQLKKYLNKSSSRSQEERFQDFVDAVEEAYIHTDQEHRLMERANDLNTQELNTLNELLKTRNSEILKLATNDSLTGLPNRYLFTDRLKQSVSRANRHQRKFCVMFIDLDRFKIINDTLGHHVGDALLKGVATRLRNTVRKSDTVARLGGDEFTVLLDEVSHCEDAATVAEKLLAQLGNAFHIDGKELIVTASIGIAGFPDHGEDVATLLQNADAAMYNAKETGRNNYQCFHPDMTSKAMEAVAIESKLRCALERDEFELHYQPQVDLRSQTIVGVEALIRWQNPDLGFVSPATFIPLAEETGLILPIGEWVLKTACKQSILWQEAGLPKVQMAVNISGRQLVHKDFLHTVDAALSESGLDPKMLELELTESVIMGDSQVSLKVLTELQGRGIHLSIDDFGTGYSSLSRLKHFPIDRLKIDRSFVMNLPDDQDDAAIARAIIAMGHSLKLNILAEGVETREQLQFMRAEGCEEIQGYLFSKPLRVADLEKILRDPKFGKEFF